MAGGYMVAAGREAVSTDAFDEVFAVHHDYVYRLAYALLGHAQDAEDVTQDVFLRVYKALPSYDPARAALRTWLTKMTVNACRTHQRRTFLHRLWQRAPALDALEEGPDLIDASLWGAPEDQALYNEVRQRIRQVLDRLRPEHRTTLILHYYLDLPAPEIARLLDCPEGTVYSRLHYARRILQGQLQQYAPHPASEVGP